MFNQLTRYVLDQWLPTTSSTAADGVETDTTRLTSSEAEDDWVLVGRDADDADDDDDDGIDSEGCSKSSSMEHLDAADDDLAVIERSPDRVVVVSRAAFPRSALLARTSSASSLPRGDASMEESWFLTPPPCFISTGPVHMETSPLENLLIEHPSMSVYTHHLRGYCLPAVLRQQERPADRPLAAAPQRQPEVQVRRATPSAAARVQALQQQQERQALKGRRAQKVQIKQACKFVNRGSLDRNNKAREVNSRNRRQRRGERSQGATRSFANNNRKC